MEPCRPPWPSATSRLAVLMLGAWRCRDRPVASPWVDLVSMRRRRSAAALGIQLRCVVLERAPGHRRGPIGDRRAAGRHKRSACVAAAQDRRAPSSCACAAARVSRRRARPAIPQRVGVDGALDHPRLPPRTLSSCARMAALWSTRTRRGPGPLARPPIAAFRSTAVLADDGGPASIPRAWTCRSDRRLASNRLAPRLTSATAAAAAAPRRAPASPARSRA
jgi:hypothetical protein